MKNSGAFSPEILIFGDYLRKNELASYCTKFCSYSDDFVSSIEKHIDRKTYKFLIFDLHPKLIVKELPNFFIRLKQENIFLIGIDGLISYRNLMDIIWIPSFNFNSRKYSDCECIVRSGWDSFLLQKRLKHKSWKPGKEVLVLTGGSDAYKLGEKLPSYLNNKLPKETRITWVKGPFAPVPLFDEVDKLSWLIIDSPENLDSLIVKSNYVLTVFGVSFFEVIQYGIPTVVFSPNVKKDNNDLIALSKENVALVAKDEKCAINQLKLLMRNKTHAKSISDTSLDKMKVNGAKKLTSEMQSLIEAT